ncbi:MAG: terminase small subunit [Bacteroidaceae bacterium]|nr:terminase small subunit [Bacteroidaceae bacterium]
MAVKKPKPYKVGDPLTPKQAKWIDEYIKTDDLTTASRNAGYSGNDKTLKSMGQQNKEKFRDLLEARRKELDEQLTKETIADLDAIYTFWTSVLNDPDARMNDRLKASEYLAKAKGAFVEKRQVQVVETDWFVDG